jgi:hypothetical protein
MREDCSAYDRHIGNEIRKSKLRAKLMVNHLIKYTTIFLIQKWDVHHLTYFLAVQCKGKSKSLCPYFFSATIIHIQGNQNTGSVLSTT